jgi:hypothetical protein
VSAESNVQVRINFNTVNAIEVVLKTNILETAIFVWQLLKAKESD